MKADGADGRQPNPALDDDSLMNDLADMLEQENTPPPMVMELARQSFGLRAIDAELASLIADSEVAGTAAAVRRGFQTDRPRLLTFRCAGLVVELEISGTARDRRILGELTPHGSATIEVRQPDSRSPRLVDADDDGRFVIDDLLPAPLSLICHRLGHTSVTTEWTSIT
jgi:hypothetical protein